MGGRRCYKYICLEEKKESGEWLLLAAWFWKSPANVLICRTGTKGWRKPNDQKWQKYNCHLAQVSQHTGTSEMCSPKHVLDLFPEFIWGCLLSRTHTNLKFHLILVDTYRCISTLWKMIQSTLWNTDILLNYIYLYQNN